MSRLDQESRHRLGQVSVATLATCLFQYGFRNCVMQDVRPLNPNATRVVGEAYTLRFIPSREDLDSMSNYSRPDFLHRRAIEECPAGGVLVIDSGRKADAGSAGDIMVTRLRARGVAGVVTDGGFRDTPDIMQLNYPAFHKAPAARSTPICLSPVDVQQPIGCGGVAVYPGDVIVGDGDGIIVIPAHLAGEVAEKAIGMTRYEAFATEQVVKGRSILGLYPATAESREEYALWEPRGDKA